MALNNKLSPWTDPSQLSSDQITPMNLNIHGIIFFNLWRINYYACQLHLYLYQFIYSVDALEDQCWLALDRTVYMEPAFQERMARGMEAAMTAPQFAHVPPQARAYKVKYRYICLALRQFLMPMTGVQRDKGLHVPVPPDDAMREIDGKLALLKSGTLDMDP